MIKPGVIIIFDGEEPLQVIGYARNNSIIAVNHVEYIRGDERRLSLDLCQEYTGAVSVFEGIFDIEKHLLNCTNDQYK